MFARLNLARVGEEILIMGNVTVYVSLEPPSPGDTLWRVQAILKIICRSSLVA
jgi:hypothetical protein